MRRQTDFVLEKAGWPALLLEESGLICRANHAACQLFGTAVQGVASLSSLLADGNAVQNAGLDRFLAGQEAAGKPSEMELACPGGQKTKFQSRVSKLSREGRNYYLLQLFGGLTPAWMKSRLNSSMPGNTPAASSMIIN